MAIQLSFGTLRTPRLEVGTSGATARGADAPLRVAVLGDFSGRESRGICEPGSLAQRRFRVFDRDNIDGMPGELGAALSVEGAGGGVEFASLDDFHPDAVYGGLDVFSELKALRAQLFEPASFAAAAERMNAWATSTEEPAAAAAPSKPPTHERDAGTPPAPGGDLLGATLAETARVGADAPSAPGLASIDRLVRQIVAPHVVPAPDARQGALVESIDTAASEHLRRLLHDPGFQALEAAWRGLEFLSRRLETGSRLKLELLDVSKAELESDLTASDELERSAAYKLLVEQAAQTPGATPFGLVLGDFSFGETERDAVLTGRIAKVAHAAGAAFFAAAHPSLVGCESFGENPEPDDWRMRLDDDAHRAWQALRALPEAGHVCLGAPRVLLRLPYGARTAPIEAFEFEEMGGESAHEHYLWGNAAYAFVCAAATAFARHGWPLDSGLALEIDGMPLHTYESDGETKIKPCAEIVLNERAGGLLRERGVSPLWTIVGTDRVRVGPCVSLAGAGL